MNYSLVGKARAKNTMQSKQVRAANVANYANREATKTVTRGALSGRDGATILLGW